MPRYLLITTRTPNFDPGCLPDHFAYLDRLRAAGKVELAGGFADATGGAYVVLTGSLAEAQAIAAADPLLTTGSSTIAVKEWLAK